MKKYLSIFIALLVLSFSLCIPASAENTKKVISFSDDYKKLYFNDSTYVRADTDMLYFDSFSNYTPTDYYENYTSSYADCPPPREDYNNIYKIELTKVQQSEIDSVEITDVSLDETIFVIYIYFLDGAQLQVDFLKEDLVDEYNRTTQGNVDEFTIDFFWPEDNKAVVTKEKLYTGSKTVIDIWDYDEEFFVYAKASTGSFEAQIGSIFIKDGVYYFYSYIDDGISSSDELIDSEIMSAEVIKLTDKDISETIQLGEERYYEDDYGYVYNDELTETVSIIFFTFVFAVVPAVIFIVSLIFAVKSKKKLYKKLLFASCGISLAEIATFIYIAFTLFNS